MGPDFIENNHQVDETNKKSNAKNSFFRFEVDFKVMKIISYPINSSWLDLYLHKKPMKNFYDAESHATKKDKYGKNRTVNCFL